MYSFVFSLSDHGDETTITGTNRGEEPKENEATEEEEEERPQRATEVSNAFQLL